VQLQLKHPVALLHTLVRDAARRLGDGWRPRWRRGPRLTRCAFQLLLRNSLPLAPARQRGRVRGLLKMDMCLLAPHLHQRHVVVPLLALAVVGLPSRRLMQGRRDPALGIQLPLERRVGHHPPLWQPPNSLELVLSAPVGVYPSLRSLGRPLLP